MTSGTIPVGQIDIWYESFGDPSSESVLLLSGATAQATYWWRARGRRSCPPRRGLDRGAGSDVQHIREGSIKCLISSPVAGFEQIIFQMAVQLATGTDARPSGSRGSAAKPLNGLTPSIARDFSAPL